jgi:hypothetical protein
MPLEASPNSLGRRMGSGSSLRPMSILTFYPKDMM